LRRAKGGADVWQWVLSGLVERIGRIFCQLGRVRNIRVNVLMEVAVSCLAVKLVRYRLSNPIYGRKRRGQIESAG